jgi:hypothetical protein
MTVPLDVGFAKLHVDATKGEGTERRAGEVTSVVDAGVELDDDGPAPDGLEEVRRRLHRPAAARAGLVAAAAAAHLARWCHPPPSAPAFADRGRVRPIWTPAGFFVPTSLGPPV